MNVLSELLLFADDSVSTLVLPFPDFIDSGNQLWSLAQDCIESLIEFQEKRTNTGSLTQVTVVCNALMQADALRVVCEQLLPKGVDNEPRRSDETGDQPIEVPVQLSEWHTVREVVKKRIYRGKVQFRVIWEEDGSQSWVDRKDLTDAAVQQFLARQNRRKKRKRKW